MRRRRPLGQWLVHMEDNDMIDVYVFAEASEKE
ncbi:hypothetical protein T01_1 [Trichinella spiralis]|uniref:Uncharacterized protein n=1 Tax=Trichinella spiralis TaxID=6334 RepID=A0A0V0XCQ5_TRISP|nr:hypothetical protein T01_2538 [Trichinella spiralis]KRX85823.1 hypothetical protein T01_10392 [Trichinella spiralis]KRX96689.1 hypothetical protein T01_1 [Trichinella spiralis]